MKTVKLIFKRALTLMLLLTLVLSMSGQAVSAAGTDDDEWGPTKHFGIYYIKYNKNNYHLYISKKKASGFKKTVVEEELYASNGKQIIYLDKNRIKSYDIKSKKVKTIKTLSKKKAWENVAGASGGYILLQCGSKIYSYNVSTKKLKVVKKNQEVAAHLYGNYYLLESTNYKRYKYVLDFFPIYHTKAGIYIMKKDGTLKLKKSLGTEYGYGIYGEGKSTKVFYAKNKAHDLYQIKWNGKKNKRVRSFKGNIFIMGVSGCGVALNDKDYLYKYKTKKLTKWN